ncbi:MAG: two-component system response regulator AtoC [Planctomycetota bacterium]|jgi:two-component system response regulator AtoC
MTIPIRETVLVVEDDPVASKVVGQELRSHGFTVDTAHNADEALKYISSRTPGAIVLDLGLPDIQGQELLGVLLYRIPEVPIVVHTGEENLSSVVDCMKRGASDYVSKSDDRSELTASVQRVLRERASAGPVEVGSVDSTPRLIGHSNGILHVKAMVARASKCDVTVLLSGESGTGKEVAARTIHDRGDRSSGPFVALNCGAVPEALIEAELFGHSSSAFTGAEREKAGYFEQASGGTLFLDEIGDLRPDMQVKLLRVLQEKAVTRVGETTARPVDLRVISATNRALRSLVDDGGFRQDLFYRLAVFPIEMPPLRERPDDVLLLAERFLVELSAEKKGSPLCTLSREAAGVLAAYAWPGNVRELRNVLECACLLSTTGVIEPSHLPAETWVVNRVSPIALPGEGHLSDAGHVRTARPLSRRAPSEDDRGILTLEEEERRIISRALELTGWNITEAANRLGVGRTTIYRKIEKYGLGNIAW